MSIYCSAASCFDRLAAISGCWGEVEVIRLHHERWTPGGIWKTQRLLSRERYHTTVLLTCRSWVLTNTHSESAAQFFFCGRVLGVFNKKYHQKRQTSLYWTDMSIEKHDLVSYRTSCWPCVFWSTHRSWQPNFCWRTFMAVYNRKTSQKRTNQFVWWTGVVNQRSSMVPLTKCCQKKNVLDQVFSEPRYLL